MRKLAILSLAVGLALASSEQWIGQVASNFYIFYVQVGNDSFAPTLSIDASNNAPAHRKWRLAGGFSEDRTQGDWMIRAVLDWTPQDTNASAVSFGTNMTADTLPNINFPVRAYIKNMGSDTLPIGTPVRLRVTGPSSYEYQDTVATTAALKHGATAMMNFTPAWHIPNVPGEYNIKVWTEAAGEMWPADDTISWDLSCAKWIEYFSEDKLTWISSAGPDKATLFDPADFGLQYPVGLQRVRAEFYLDSRLPWTDSSFQFLIYGDDGATLLYESETLEAPAGMPGAPIAHTLDSMLVIPSGTFYVAVASVSGNGRPTVFSDSCASVDHSYYGIAGGWTPHTYGEWFISASLQGNVGSENAHYTIPDPQPGVSPATPLLFSDAADTLKYDDGAPARSWYWHDGGNGWGMKFITPSDSVTLDGALVYLGSNSPGGTKALVKAYADDGINGAPGTEILASDTATITMGQWNFIPFTFTSVEEGFEPGLSGPSLRITNYPNPVTDQVTLKWQVPSSMPVSVNLYDATGRLVRNLYAANDKARVGTLTMEARSLAAGIYLVRLETAKGSATRKVVVDR